MPRPIKAAGSVALVTGANRGIGLAIVRELAARGAKKIYAGVRNPADLAGEFGGLAVVVEVVPLDVTDQAAVQAAAACPDVNLLVNNAGRFENQRLVLTGDPDAARREMEVNYFGVLNMTRAFAPVLGASGGGYIVNVLSVAGAFPAPFMGGYSPAKAATLFLSSITRSELAVPAGLTASGRAADPAASGGPADPSASGRAADPAASGRQAGPAAMARTWAAIIGLDPPVATAAGAELPFGHRTIRFVAARDGRTGIVAVDLHATDRDHVAGLQGELCRTLIRFV